MEGSSHHSLPMDAFLQRMTVGEHAAADPAFYLRLLSGSLACCATMCVGVMLVYLQAILKPLIFAIFLMYMLAPAVRWLTTPVRIRLPRRRASRSHDDEELQALIGGGANFGGARRRGSSTTSSNAAAPATDAAAAAAAERRASAAVLQVACPDWLAIALVLVLVFGFLWTLGSFVVSGLSSLQAKIPMYREQLLLHLERFTRWLERVEPRAKDALLAGLEKWLRELPLPSIMEDAATAVVGGVESLLLVLLFTVYLLQGRARVARRGGSGGDGSGEGAAAGAPAGSPCDFSRPASSASLARAAAAVGSDSSAGADRLYAEVDRQVRQYLVLKTAVCLGVGLLVGVIFSLLQLELAFLFGLVTFVANYVPNVGAIFATVLPLPLVLLDPSVSGAQQLLAFLLPLGAHMLVGNVLEPKLFGSSMELHPVVVLLALAFWGSLWGVSGAILSVPLTATCRIALEAVENPWSATLLWLLRGAGVRGGGGRAAGGGDGAELSLSGLRGTDLDDDEDLFNNLQDSPRGV